MNNERYNQIIDDVYVKFEKHCVPGTGKKMSKEDFIDICKTNPEFSETWGLEIDERELSHDERFEIYKNSNIGGRVLQNHITAINFKQFHFNEVNIPTKLITITHNNETIESYE